MKLFFTYILFPLSILANTDYSLCNISGLADFYTLSLTWLPGACKISQVDYPECSEASLHHNFVLHGLWPDKENCGIYYEFCQNVTYQENKAQYPAIEISKNNLDELAKVMPNIKYNGHLEKHEWWKHGTCTLYSPNKYFQISINLTNQINNSKFVKEYIINNIGQMLDVKDLYKAFDDAFGNGASKSLNLLCREGHLEEIRINLPINIEEGLSDITNIIGVMESSNKNFCSKDYIFLSE